MKRWVACPAMFTPNHRCGIRCPIHIESNAIPVRCPFGHSFIARKKDIRHD